jgi:hypothetical protein
VAILACYTGKVEDGERLVSPLKSFGRPAGDVLVRRPYVQMQSLLDATQPKGRRYYWKSEYLSGVDPALCEKVIAHGNRIRSPHSAIILMQLEGALNRLPPEYSPVGNRDAHYVLNITGSWVDPADDETNMQWARDAWNDMRAFSTGGTYINFLTQDEGPDRIQAALGPSLQRLAEIKAKWDPNNVFRSNRNIRPLKQAEVLAQY